MTNSLQDLHVSGTLTCQRFTPPPGSIGNASVRMGDYIDGRKVQHGIRQVHAQTGEAHDEQKVLHVAVGDGRIMGFHAGALVPAAGDAEVSVDLLMNGNSILGSPIVLTDGQAARETMAATFAAPQEYEAGDVFELVVAVTPNSGTLAFGVFVSLVGRENPQ